MKVYIIIPAHNEEHYISHTLNSLASQTVLANKVVIVNDNSTDNTEKIVNTFKEKHEWIHLVNSNSSSQHMPGSKVINAFYKGFETLDSEYDIICKFDADLIFPDQYIETLIEHFKSHSKVGMVGGFCYIKKNNQWVLENLTRKDHIRGALKAYRKDCFKIIGGLKREMGWDTIDELLAKFYKWQVLTDEDLKVKHLKPTGYTYHKKSRYLQGEALYRMRLGFILMFLSAVKSGINKRSFLYFLNTVIGFLKANSKGIKPLVTKEQGAFIRQTRWKGISETLKL